MAQTAKKETKKLVTAEAEIDEAVLDDEKMELLEDVETGRSEEHTSNSVTQ